MKGWPRHPPEVDTRSVGLGFIDVLFALVVGKVLDSLARPASVPPVGRWQLALAFVVTVGSWVGYHNSLNRPTYLVRFPNLPLCQFILDTALVVVYYFLAVTAEGVTRSARPASALPEVWLVATSFVLYVLWDWVGLLIRKDARYLRRPESGDLPRRRRVSYGFAVGSLLIAAVVAAKNPDTRGAVEAIDAVLMACAILFRFAKEYVTRAGDRPVQGTSDSAMLREIANRLDLSEGPKA